VLQSGFLGPFVNIAQGAVVDGGFGTTAPGDTILAELGGESLGLRTLGCSRFMLQWDALAALEGGLLGNEHPYLFLIGPHMLGSLELDARILRASTWSPYVGVGIAGEASLLEHPGLASSQLDTINYVDGVGGAVGKASVRAVFGGSMLTRRHSLLFYVFGQEAGQASEPSTPSVSFTEFGVGARLDITQSVLATLEGVIGVSPSRANTALGFYDRTMHMGASASFRKIFGNGVWIGITAFIEQDTDHIAYTSGLAYDTGNAPSFRAALVFGVPLWRSKR
jgi:hypothetical protein